MTSVSDAQRDYRKLIGTAYHKAAVAGRRKSNASRLMREGSALGHSYEVFACKFPNGDHPLDYGVLLEVLLRGQCSGQPSEEQMPQD